MLKKPKQSMSNQKEKFFFHTLVEDKRGDIVNSIWCSDCCYCPMLKQWSHKLGYYFWINVLWRWWTWSESVAQVQGRKGRYGKTGQPCKSHRISPSSEVPLLAPGTCSVYEFRDQIMGPNKLNGAQIRQRSLSTVHNTEALKGQPDI